MLDAQTGDRPSAGMYRNPGPSGVKTGQIFRQEKVRENSHANETGGASRFFFRADYDESEIPA